MILTSKKILSFDARPNFFIFSLNRQIPFEDVLTILVSILLKLRDERKGRESVRLTSREKRGREAFDLNSIRLHILFD